MDTVAREELMRLRDDAERLRAERDRIQSVLNTSGSAITVERATQERLAQQVRALEAENRTLREDLGFFEKLTAGSGTEGVAIRGPAGRSGRRHAAQMAGAGDPAGQERAGIPRPAGAQPSGTQDGKPWMMQLPGGAQPLQFRQYRRLEGMVDLPPQVVVKNVSARVVEGVPAAPCRMCPCR